LLELNLIDVLGLDFDFDQEIVASGTISMTGSPAVTTPPTVFAVDWNTMPSCGARISVRLS